MNAPEQSEPAYRTLAAELRARIAAGLYPDGVRLPPRPNSPPNSG